MTLIGKVLAGRYEILEEVGNGGMAVVYKAKCQLLNRFVAVKVLRPDLQNDAEFVRRFNVEAQAAASLAHPNIVSIYDVGYEDGLHYIVMEFIEGKTLKEYIEEKRMLPWREAVGFAIQVAKGLEQAHKNSIIHRDIKPHNIIMTADGVLKVTDFGIARANVQTTVTCEDSAIGSVHYISPEQARGGYTDERSDIYSLAVVLYEMLTGKVPFESDRPVTVAIMHLQDKPVSPRTYNISIPLALERIVLKAMSKELSARYRNVSEMIVELQSVLNNTTASNNTESAANGLFVAPGLDSDMDATKVIPTINVEKISGGVNTGVVPADLNMGGNLNDSDELDGNGVGVNPDEKEIANSDDSRNVDSKDMTAKFPTDGEEKASQGNAVPLFEEGTELDLRASKLDMVKVDKKKSRRVIALAVLSAVIVVAGLTLFLGDKFGLFTICSTNSDIPEIPNVVGMLYDEAVEMYDNVDDETAKYKFDLVRKKNVKSNKPEGTILLQTPESGSKVDINQSIIEISLEVSIGDDKITLLDYSKKSKDDVKVALRNLGLEPEFVEVFSEDIPKGFVVNQNPQVGSKVEKGSIIIIQISKGADDNNKGILVPSYIGEKDIDEVEAAIVKAGFKFEAEEKHHETVPLGTVISQNPNPGTKMEKGEKITVYVSLGPEEEENPNEREPEDEGSGNSGSGSQSGTESGNDGNTGNESGGTQTPDDNTGTTSEPGEETREKNKQFVTIYGPKDAESALVEVKVDGNLIYSKKLKRGASTTLKIESYNSAVLVEILHDGILQQKRMIDLA